MQYSTQKFFEPTFFDHLGHIHDFTKEYHLLVAVSDIYIYIYIYMYILHINSGPKVGRQYIVHRRASSVYILLAHSVYAVYTYIYVYIYCIYRVDQKWVDSI